MDDAPGVVIVNETLARKQWPGESAIGKRLKLGNPNARNPWLTVVGVAKDVRYREWEVTRVDLYIPFEQRAQHRSDFVVRTATDPATLIEAVHREVYSIDKDQPVSSVTTVERLVEDTLAAPRFHTLLLGLFAACAVLLAVIGVHGVLAYSITQRTQELGLRVALGASPANLLLLVLGHGLKLALLGAACGSAGAFVLNRLLSRLLFGVSPVDPATYVLVSGLLILVALVASTLPALWAARVDPVRALQHE